MTQCTRTSLFVLPVRRKSTLSYDESAAETFPVSLVSIWMTVLSSRAVSKYVSAQ
jgi:hypothetical protein